MHFRIAARTAGGPVIGEMIQRPGVAAFLSRTASVDVVRHFVRSAWYCSVVWSPWTGGSYSAHPVTPGSRARTTKPARNDCIPLMVEAASNCASAKQITKCHAGSPRLAASETSKLTNDNQGYETPARIIQPGTTASTSADSPLSARVDSRRFTPNMGV